MAGEEFSKSVKRWLKKEGRNNSWLADKCGVKLSAVYSWFSTRGWPEGQKQAVEKIMGLESDEESHIRVPFTDDQLARTHKAASVVSSDFQEYCQRAIEAQVSLTLSLRPNPPMDAINDTNSDLAPGEALVEKTLDEHDPDNQSPIESNS